MTGFILLSVYGDESLLDDRPTIVYLIGPLPLSDYSIRGSLTYNHELAWFF